MNRRESFKVYKVFDNKIDIIFSRVALLFFVRFLIKILIDLGEKKLRSRLLNFNTPYPVFLRLFW